MIICSACGKPRKACEFQKYTRPRPHSKLTLMCSSCRKLYNKNMQLLHNYGITLARYNEMLIEQSGLCAICRQSGRLVVDHDHKTGKVRALLCDHCNCMLGGCGDSVLVLRLAAEYVEKFQKQ